MKELELIGNPREIGLESGLTKIRLSGEVPAVIYGEGQTPVHVSVSEKEMDKALNREGGQNTVIRLKIKNSNGEVSKLVMIKEVQYEPVRGRLLHADFQNISLEKKITVKVLVKAEGVAEGVKNGGILEYLARQLTVRCLPANIPDAIIVDVTNLKVAQALHVSDLKLPEGIEILESKTRPVITVGIPSEIKEEDLAAATAAPSTEPEVIGEKEREARRLAKEGEGKEGAAPAGKEGAKPAAPAGKEAPKAAAKEGPAKK